MVAVVEDAMVAVVEDAMVVAVEVRGPWILGQKPEEVEVVEPMEVSQVVVAAVLPFLACLSLVGR